MKVKISKWKWLKTSLERGGAMPAAGEIIDTKTVVLMKERARTQSPERISGEPSLLTDSTAFQPYAQDFRSIAMMRQASSLSSSSW